MARESGRKVIATNRKARHDYHIDDTVEAGLVLVGTEVKSLRAGRATITEAYAVVEGDELWLQALFIPEYSHGSWTNHEPRRRRKLLLKRAELDKLIRAVDEKGVTLVPLSLYFKDGYAKIELATARGKQSYDKRHAIAKREADREAQRALANRRRQSG